MKAIKSGYWYEVPTRTKQGPQIEETGSQVLTFLETNAAGETVTAGAFTEDLLDVLIDRQRTLQEKLPSREGAIALTKLEEAKLWLGARQSDRKARGVHMTHSA